MSVCFWPFIAGFLSGGALGVLAMCLVQVAD